MRITLAGYPSHDLAENIALGVNMIGGDRARRPDRCLLLERQHDRIAIEDRARKQRIENDRQPGGMIENVADQQALLAVLGKFRPVCRNRGVGIDHAAIDQDVEGDAGNTLGDRHHADDGIALPGLRPGFVAIAGPDVEHLLAVHQQGRCRADLFLYRIVFKEGIHGRPELGFVFARKRVGGITDLDRFI
uniref:hypothetical protein n=1 Tax=Neorhizobium sp. EC2-8 TaxID=3129230 RepID=UPI0031012E9A